ncbi:MAG: thiamine phosphate synthase [Eubacteriaceae bacterium]|jgi:thiamine-phosphate diphosphorylase
MSEILCFTSRSLCRENVPGTVQSRSDCEQQTAGFLKRIDEIAACQPAAIVLREKDLPESEYSELAARVLAVCRARRIRCILHSFVASAIDLGADAIHLPLPELRKLTENQKDCFKTIGASCHSVADAREAEALGCTYITAGHIFDTACKKGLPGRGIPFLKSVVDAVDIPVYAIGGIGPENAGAVLETGAAGICVMSSVMQCPDVGDLFRQLESAAE